MLSREELMEFLKYDRATGVFVWIKTSPQKNWTLGKQAACLSNKGYVVIRIKGKTYLAHRLAWLFETGEWPADGIDHVNGIKTDNRLENLRECNQSQNLANRGKSSNNKSGWKGVSWVSSKAKWRSQICVRRQTLHLGYFDDVKEAAESYIFAALEHHGEYARLE